MQVTRSPYLLIFYTAFCLSATSQQKTLAIYHAFDEQLKDVANELSHLAWAGYSHVQVSPLQKSRGTGTPADSWYLAYQPLGYTIEGKYGNEDDFKNLIRMAKKVGIKIIVDVVFNHVAKLDGVDAKAWIRATYQKCVDNDGTYNEYIHRLVIRHETEGFTADDFNPYRVYQHFNVNFYDPVHQYSTPTYPEASLECGIWIYGDLPSLNQTSPRVQAAQLQYLDHLIALGTKGFRFDASKHLPPPTWRHFAEHLNEKNIFFYGEYLGGSSEYAPYNPHGPSTDYPLFYSLVKVFQWQRTEHEVEYGNLHNLRVPTTNGDSKAITFAENHDTKAGRESGGSEGLRNSSIMDDTDRKLATLFLIARHDGVPLVLNSEHKLFLPDIINALAFRKYMYEHGNPPDYIEQLDEEIQGINLAHNLIFLKRDNQGFMVLNKSGTKLNLNIRLSTAKGTLAGTYRQITHQKGRFVFISDNVLHLTIPARCVLFFVRDEKKQKRPIRKPTLPHIPHARSRFVSESGLQTQ